MGDPSVKKARQTALVIGTSLCLMLISFVYAFVKQAETKRQMEIGMECERISLQLSMELQIKTQEAEMQFDRAQAALIQAEEMRAKAETASKKK